MHASSCLCTGWYLCATDPRRGRKRGGIRSLPSCTKVVKNRCHLIELLPWKRSCCENAIISIHVFEIVETHFSLASSLPFLSVLQLRTMYVDEIKYLEVHPLPSPPENSERFLVVNVPVPVQTHPLRFVHISVSYGARRPPQALPVQSSGGWTTAGRSCAPIFWPR